MRTPTDNNYRYRRQTCRIVGLDYGAPGTFFITINIKNNIPRFGKNKKGVIELSELGRIVEQEWLKTLDIRREMNISLGAYVIMPDHFHGLITIGDNQYNKHQQLEYSNQFGPQRKNLASVIRGFKSAVTVYARKNRIPFEWQRKFYEMDVKSNQAYLKITAYIQQNPLKHYLQLENRRHQKKPTSTASAS